MRRGVWLLALLAMAACSQQPPAPQATAESIATVPSIGQPGESNPPAGSSTTTSTTLGPRGRIGGVLPDGTPYTVVFDARVDRTVISIGAAIMIDLDGTTRPLGRTIVTMEHPGDPGLDELGRYTVPVGGGGIVISVFPEMADQVPDIEALLDDSIAPGSYAHMPSVELFPPLRWATDEEIPLQMQVEYPGFVVRRGCGELAAACSRTGAVQVIPADRVFSGVHGLPAEPVWIESPAPRPVDQEAYLPPGPLSARGAHDVIWTGSEMIVWGGASGDRLPDLVDGAAFDPETSTWRMLPPAPLESSRITRAVWAGDRMIVIAREATIAYHPGADRWSVVGDGLYPPEAPGFTVWTGFAVAAWTSSGIHEFDPTSGVWTQLPSPGFGGSGWGEAALRTVDGRLYAIGLGSVYCGGRQIAIWETTEWSPVPTVSLATEEYADCSYASQTGVAAGHLVVWDDEIHPTMAFDPAAGRWVTIETIPLGGTEGPAGPVPLGEGFLVPQWGEAAILDGATMTWSHAALPGDGDDTHMVWTGAELLMWGATCCYGDGSDRFTSIDAWRWTPPALGR